MVRLRRRGWTWFGRVRRRAGQTRHRLGQIRRRPLSRVALGLIPALLLLTLSACTAGPNQQVGTTGPEGTVAGFWLGLWHGIIAPVTFVISLFADDVNIYEVHNNGNWYDFGFFVGFGVLLGGGASGRRYSR